jgi:hypothetical protein
MIGEAATVCNVSSSASESSDRGCLWLVIPAPQTAKYSCSSSEGFRRSFSFKSTWAHGWQKNIAVSSSIPTDRHAILLCLEVGTTADIDLTCRRTQTVGKAPSHRGLYSFPIDCCHLCSVILSDSLTLSTQTHLLYACRGCKRSAPEWVPLVVHTCPTKDRVSCFVWPLNVASTLFPTRVNK